MPTSTTNRLIGKGIKFPCKPNSRGGVDTSESIDRINQSLFILFETRKGSRLMMPDFGSSLYMYRFDPYDNILLERIRNTVNEDVKRWEPRINLTNIEFSNSIEDIENYILYVSLTYKIINTEISGNFVYPFRRDVYDMNKESSVRF